MNFVEMFTALEHFLNQLIATYGWFTYPIVFAIIFCETGLVIAPVLPGDSLLFLSGVIAAKPEGNLNVAALCLLLSVAAILGDTVNYWIGHLVGPKIFHKEKVRFLNKEHLLKAHAFYEKHGGITIIVARFMPFIRTFAPFVAGIGSMTYWKFLAYNVVGGLLWVVGVTLLGYFCGNIKWVKEHLSLVAAGIVFVSILPGIIAYLRHRLRPAPKA